MVGGSTVRRLDDKVKARRKPVLIIAEVARCLLASGRSSSLSSSAQAVHYYSEAIAAKSNFVPALYNLAVSEAASDPTWELGLFRRLVALQPDNAEELFNEGPLLESTGQAALGRQDVAKAVDIHPSLGPNG